MKILSVKKKRKSTVVGKGKYKNAKNKKVTVLYVYLIYRIYLFLTLDYTLEELNFLVTNNFFVFS